MPSGDAKARLKAALLRMKPAARAVAVKNLRRQFGGKGRKTMAEGAPMMNGLQVNPETGRVEQDQERALAERAEKDPLLGRQEQGTTPTPATD